MFDHKPAIRSALCFATVVLLTSATQASPIRFLVSEYPTTIHGDSYVVVLDEPQHIAHARALITDPEAISNRILLAEIEAGFDGINRDHLVEGAPPWSWHVSKFIDFVDFTAEILDGWPSFVESDVDGWIENTDGMIGFWEYTVTAELGPVCVEDIAGDDLEVNFADLLLLLSSWGPCMDCLADLDRDGHVAFGDLLMLLSAWGPCV